MCLSLLLRCNEQINPGTNVSDEPICAEKTKRVWDRWSVYASPLPRVVLTLSLSIAFSALALPCYR